jgi:serine/threonine protein kinase
MPPPVVDHSEPLAGADPNVERRRLEESVHGQYQVVREVGRGGMGVVFLARDVALHRAVAVKVLRSEFTSSDDHRERFRREARLTARLSHPGIVPVYTFGESDDLVYIVMKYIQGESLAERLRTAGPLAARDTARVMFDLAEALDYAHGEGMVHRDLKAENVLIEKSGGRAFLTDFGVARLCDSSPDEWERSHALGTPDYMSPEQAVGEPDLDGRSDLYSLGVLGYQMLSGKLPFAGSSFAALAAQHIVCTPPDLYAMAPEAPRPLVEAINRCLAKEREERWSTGKAFCEATHPIRDRSTVRSALRHPAWVLVVAGLAAAAVVLSTLGR